MDTITATSVIVIILAISITITMTAIEQMTNAATASRVERMLIDQSHLIVRQV